jgi:hypothetical protein
MRLFLTAALALTAACGMTPDERPLTLEVVTLDVLAPTCGQVQCHSTTTKTQNLAFDTVKAAGIALNTLGVDDVDVIDGVTYIGGDLLDVIEGRGDVERMPPDAPLADQDHDLLTAWIMAGTPGL